MKKIKPTKKFTGIPAGIKAKTITNFWQWGYSNLISNMDRATLAEYLVAWAIGDDKNIREPWRSYDLKAKSGKRIEVKATGALQDWKSRTKARPVFYLRQSRFWDKTKGMSKTKKYNADIYVLCYHFEDDIQKADPMDLRQWIFWVFSRRQIRSIMEARKSMSVSWLQRNYVSCEWGELDKI